MPSIAFYRAMLYAERGVATASRPSVRLSVRQWRRGIVVT